MRSTPPPFCLRVVAPENLKTSTPMTEAAYPPHRPLVVATDGSVVANRFPGLEVKLPPEVEKELRAPYRWNVPKSGARQGLLSLKLPSRVTRAAMQAAAQHSQKCLESRWCEDKWLCYRCNVRDGTLVARIVYAEPNEYSRGSFRFICATPKALDINLHSATISPVPARVFGDRIVKIATSRVSFFATVIGDNDNLITFWIKALQASACTYSLPVPPQQRTIRTRGSSSSHNNVLPDDDDRIVSFISSAPSPAAFPPTITEAPVPSFHQVLLFQPTQGVVLEAEAPPRQNVIVEEAPAAAPALNVASSPAPALKEDVASSRAPPASTTQKKEELRCLFCGTAEKGIWLPRPRDIAIPALFLMQYKTTCVDCQQRNADQVIKERTATERRATEGGDFDAYFRPRSKDRAAQCDDEDHYDAQEKNDAKATAYEARLFFDRAKADPGRRDAYLELATALWDAAREARPQAAPTARAAVAVGTRTFSLEPVLDYGLLLTTLLPLECDVDLLAIRLKYATAAVVEGLDPFTAASETRWDNYLLASRLDALEALATRLLAAVVDKLVAQVTDSLIRAIVQRLLEPPPPPSSEASTIRSRGTRRKSSTAVNNNTRRSFIKKPSSSAPRGKKAF